MGGKPFVENKLLLQQWHCLIQKGARTQYIDRGWCVLYTQKRDVTSIMPSDIDTERRGKNNIFFSPQYWNMQRQIAYYNFYRVRVIKTEWTDLEMP